MVVRLSTLRPTAGDSVARQSSALSELHREAASKAALGGQHSRARHEIRLIRDEIRSPIDLFVYRARRSVHGVLIDSNTW